MHHGSVCHGEKPGDHWFHFAPDPGDWFESLRHLLVLASILTLSDFANQRLPEVMFITSDALECMAPGKGTPKGV